MDFIVIIPARFNSKRLLNKPLIDINGKPMVVHVMEKALASGANRVIVATDHIKIVQAIKYFHFEKGEVFLTKNCHESGTERLSEVISYYNFNDDQIVVNVQSDEPLIPSKIIFEVADSLFNNKTINMVTAATPINSFVEVTNVNNVKVVVDINNYAMYFSRSIIPYFSQCNSFINKHTSYENNIWLHHIGIYAYRVNFIYRYIQWPKSPLEQIESLEQLRVLWNGEKIYVKIVSGFTLNLSVDSIEELNKVICILKNTNNKLDF